MLFLRHCTLHCICIIRDGTITIRYQPFGTEFIPQPQGIGETLTFAIVSGPALLAGSTVDLTGATGLVVIRVSQVGNLIYGAAPDVTRTFTVSASVQTVYFGTVSRQ